MSVVLKTHRFSVEEYHRLGETGILREDDRVELIEGELVDMAPMGSRHAGCVSFLTWALQQSVGERAVVHVQNPLALGMDSEPEPDVMLLAPREHDPFYRTAHPGPDDVLLLIEVADTSLTYDRQVKLPLYAHHGIRQVWLVDLSAGVIEDHRWPEPDGYGEVRTLRRGEVVGCEALPGVELGVGEILS